MYLLLLTILFISLYFFLNYKKENFEVKNDKVRFKKTDSYNLVYKNKTFCIWEPNPIREYFPIGQCMTKANKPPEFSSLLVNKHDIKIRPRSYELISSTNNGMKIWVPVVSDNYGICSFIFSRNMPSLNRIQVLPKSILKKTMIDEMVMETNNFNVWSIFESNYIYVKDIINKSKMNVKLFTPNMSHFEPDKKILCITTSNYKKLYSDDKISIWRPLPPKNYRSLGDCIFDKNENPNGKKNIIVAHKSFCYPIIDYHDIPVCNFDNVSVWKPNCPNGYSTLGHVVSFDKKEPLGNEVYSIPLEYCKKNDKIKNIKNSLEDGGSNYSIWNNNNYCYGSSNLKKPNNIYDIDMNYSIIEKNLTEIPHEVSMNINSDFNKELDDNYIEEVKNVLSQRTGVSHYRFQDFKLLDNKIYFTIDSKPLNTKEDSIEEIMDTLIQLTQKKPIIVNESLSLKNINSNQTIHNDNISIDNSDFNSKIKDHIK